MRPSETIHIRDPIHGTLPVSLEPGDLVVAVRELVDEVRTWARREIELKSPSSPVTASFDAGRLMQAGSNLVCNAIEHSEGRVVVDVRATPEVRVVSEGPRIPGQRLNTLYEPFHAGGGEGLGLGLWIARQVAIAHKGYLHYRHHQGRNIFLIGLPPLVDDTESSG